MQRNGEEIGSYVDGIAIAALDVVGALAADGTDSAGEQGVDIDAEQASNDLGEEARRGLAVAAVGLVVTGAG